MNVILSPGPLGLFAFLFIVLLVLLGIATWMILAASRFTQGGVVERPERVPQLYGYAVCLVAVIVALFSVIAIVGSAFSAVAPQLNLDSEYSIEPSVSSFEAFRATYGRELGTLGADRTQPRADSIPEPELRRRYDALRAERVERTRLRSMRSLVTGVIALLIALALFVTHWRWLRRFRPAS